jgi:hypothetical protein
MPEKVKGILCLPEALTGKNNPQLQADLKEKIAYLSDSNIL